jgi:hypothetical protein
MYDENKIAQELVVLHDGTSEIMRAHRRRAR